MKESKKSKIKNHLEKYGSISSWEAITLYRATRLSAIIFDLRKEGMNIQTQMIYEENGENYGRYIFV